MAKKLQDVIQLAEDHAGEVSSSADNWTDYLDTASRLYRYSFEDLLLIHAQRPDATACASYDVWNKKMGCYVKRGSEGIALIDENGHRPKLHYVFDVSNVGKTANGRHPVLWNLTEDGRENMSEYLLDAYDLNRDISYSLNDTLFLLARNLVDNNAEEAINDLLLSPDSASLGEDVHQISVKFQFLMMNSAYYTLAKRCGLDPKQYFTPAEAFQDVSDFKTHTLLSYLGKAVQEACEPVLMDIGKYVRKMALEKSKLVLESQTQIGYNRNHTDNQFLAGNDKNRNLTGGTGYGETGVHTQGGLSVPESDDIDGRAGGRDREVRDAEEIVSEGETRGNVHTPSSDGTALETSGGRGSAVSGTAGGADEGSGREISQSGQGDRPDGLGGTSEQSEIDSGREHLSGIDLHLADSIEPEPEYDEAEAEIVSALDLPKIPSMDTQIREIEVRQAAVFAGANSIPAEVIDTILRTGGNKSGSILRLIHNFMSEQPVEDYTEFVRTEYGTGGKGFIINGQEYAVWFDSSGMQIAAGRSVHDQTLDRALLSWADVSGRIHQLLNQGEYAPQVVLDAARAAVIKEHAGSLEFFRREMMAKDIPELVFKDMALFKGGFPDVEEKLSAMLNDQNELNELVARLDGFRKVWIDHPEVMTSRLYNPEKMYQQFRRLSLKTVPFLARAGFSVKEPEVFITQDEIDTYLQRGTPYGDGRISVYSFFLMNQDADARTDFLKQKYGDGGQSNALSGADDSWADYGSKGLLLRRNGLGEGSVKVLLTWPKVRKRIEYLLDNGLFLKGSDYDHMDEYERKAIASRINGFFYRLTGPAVDAFAERFGGLGFIATAEPPKEILYESLADETARNEVLQLMESAFAEVPIDIDSYENKRKLLSEVRGYVEGTFTIFPKNNAVVTETQPEESITDANEKENRYEVIESEGWVETTWTVQDNHTGELYHDRYDEPNFFSNKEDAEDFCAELNENYQIERGENLHQMSLFDMAATDYILQKDTEFASEDEIEERRDTFEDINTEEVRQRLEENGIVNGEVADPERLEQSPLIMQAMEDAEQLASEEGRDTAASDRFHVIDVDWHIPSKSDIKYSIWDDGKNGYYVDNNGDTVGFISRWEAAKYRDGLISLEDAKGLIKEYLRGEFDIDDEEDFIDLTNIGLGYTTVSDAEIPIEASVDLVNHRLERKLNERIFDVRQYDSLDKLIVEELENLDFNALMDVTDEQIEEALVEEPENISKENADDKQAVPIAARYQSDETSQEIAILQYPNGKFYNHYGYDEKRGMGNAIAGPFDTLEAAKRMILRHRPGAKEIVGAQIMPETSEPSIEAQGFQFRAGDAVYLESSNPFIIDSIGMFDIHMHDSSLAYPIGRVESRESFQRLMERYVRNQPAPVAARYQSTMHMQEGYSEDIAILHYPNGQFFIHYNFDEERGTGASSSGPLDSLEKARTDLIAHNPDAVEVPLPEIEHKTVQNHAADAPETFEYQGYHFQAVGVFPDNGANANQIHADLVHGAEPFMGNIEGSHVPYSYDEFYQANNTPSADVFRCMETGRLYTPGQNELFGYDGSYEPINAINIQRTSKTVGELFEHYLPVVKDGVMNDTAYQNACKNSDRENAQIEGKEAVNRVVLSISETELTRLYYDNTSFHNRLQNTVFEETYSELSQHPLTEDEILAENPVSVQIDGKWQTFPNQQAAEDAINGENEHQPQNFRIMDDELGVGGQKTKYRANIAAVKLLKQLEAENRLATPEEQEVLSRYVGWGGIPQAFDHTSLPWAGEYKELQETLTKEEYREARSSTLNAFYTPPIVIKAMYEALENFGLRSGNLLEPSCGTGNFMGLKPESMDGVKMYGVELDSISGRIAQQLYQKNMISVQGFETTQYPDNFFDCVIGNVPFGNYKVPDQRYDRYNFMIHDYFIAKSLDLVRPGGVVAVITSSGTMDKTNDSVREYIANRADLLGAIRLPDNTFSRNAGTEVVTDILFLQKRDMAAMRNASWTSLGMTSDGYVINSYFVEHPDMILGKLAMESTQYGRDAVTVKPMEGMKLSEQLRDAISQIKGQIAEYELADDELAEQEDVIPAEASVRNFSFTEVNGEVYYRENSQMKHVSLSREAKGRTLGLVSLRNTVRELIDCQMDNGSDREVEVLQERLNSQYEAYTSRYGLINSKTNKKAFDSDSSYSLLASLEVLDDDGKLIRKADIFNKRTIRPASPIVSADNSADALALSISEKARVDLKYMSELLGTPGEYGQIISDLNGAIFLDPVEESANDPTVGWHTNDDYLSGNVRSKLAVAREYAQKDERFAVNVEYLEKVQPKDLDASEIDVRLGATWIKTDYIQQFMEELFDIKYYYRSRIKVQYSRTSGEWEISNKTLDKFNFLATTSYGTGRANGFRLLEDALNLRDTKIYDTVEGDDGKDRRVLNSKETTVAQQKQEAIKDAFKDWIFKDMTRREDVCKTYNILFNSVRPREYDGSNIRFVGMNPEITLMDHQKNAVAHMLYGNNTLLAHCVGAGKTFEMASAAMESIRLGLARKCLFVVPNHLTQQWGSEFLQLYPGANILVATKKDFQPANRRKFCSRIATGQYDAVIIGHSQFEKIPLSLERQKISLQAQIDEITEGIYEEQANKSAWDRSKSFTVKQMEKMRKSLEGRLAKLNDQSRKDDVVTFEQLGVDRLFVDESHYYKNLYIYTKMRNVAGISQTEALKSSDMLMKCQYLDEITGGKGITFATGTPVSNSMVEMFTLMRYLQHDTLEKMNLTSFDAWASTFGETITSIELTPEGTGYRAKTRFARFYNLPELISVFKESADVQTQDMLDLPVPEAEYIDEKLDPSEIQKRYVEECGDRADAVRNGNIDPRIDNMLKIVTDGRKLALDQRLIDDMLPDEDISKVNRCVDNIYTIWKETESNRSAQLVFSDLSTPKADGSFNIYDDIRNKLEAKGIPPKEIAFIHTANTEVKKEELFKKVRTGQVRILLGSTSKMGAGTNVQDRLIALHHLDVPWKPSDLEQREGRILRQGNQNKKVKIFRYVTEGTFDAYSWQTLENKQKFISQIMTSKSPVRSAEDVDDVALNYAEIKALATSNPYIKEKMALDVDVSKLKLLKADYKSNHYRLESDVAKTYPVAIKEYNISLECIKKDLEAIEPLLPFDNEHFEMNVNGQQFTNAKEAGEEILNASRALQVSKVFEGKIGEYHGFEMVSRYSFTQECFVLTLKNHSSYVVNLGRDPLGNITRINNVLKTVSKMVPDVEQKIQSLQQWMDSAKEELQKPFAKEQELLEKSARLSELNSLLNMDKKDNVDAVAIDENAPVESDVRDNPGKSDNTLEELCDTIEKIRSKEERAV